MLLINHAKRMYQKNWNGGKEYMVSALFRYLDLDGNGFLQRDELEKVCQSTSDFSDIVSLFNIICLLKKLIFVRYIIVKIVIVHQIACESCRYISNKDISTLLIGFSNELILTWYTYRSKLK